VNLCYLYICFSTEYFFESDAVITILELTKSAEIAKHN
jgi:hypothetical protein